MRLAFYRRICELEAKWRHLGFNQRPLGLAELLVWAEKLKAIPLDDRTLRGARLVNYRGHIFLYYNPYVHPDELILVLGHELGHILLEHVGAPWFQFHNRDIFRKNGFERDAGIIGFLAWLPTRELKKLLRNPELEHPEALARELATCDSEWPFLVKACEARLRIWRGLQRIVKEVPK